jgi:hypothetical protein
MRLAALLFVASTAFAQIPPAELLMSQTSGTSGEPATVSMPMLMGSAGRWTLMLHGDAFVERARDSGPRGGEETFSTNSFMGGAYRTVGGGALMLRGMLSLEPATISGRKYPELFQTGETAYGKQLIDGQHPHDFFMELAAEYAHRAGRGDAYLYLAPVGEPAIGPTAFMHRNSAHELPQAPIGHHFEDSTHIAFNVVTAGVTADRVTAEASAFHGGEPDERRYRIDGGRIDSWSARIQWRPFSNTHLQISHARLTKPETIEPGYATRSTASLTFEQPWSFARLSTTFVYGRVYKEVHDRTLDAYLGEASLTLFRRHHLVARGEIVDKDELFPHPILTVVPRPPLPVRVFHVQAYTLGYTIDILRLPSMTTGAGANVTTYRFPPILDGFYGPHPHAVLLYLHARLGS